MKEINNLNIEEIQAMASPREVINELPNNEKINRTIYESREVIKNILEKMDKRFLVIVGPCSLHDKEATLEYAKKLSSLRRKYLDKIYIVMRTYFEKPRTTIGWRGLITDPNLDDTYDFNQGVRTTREILLDIANLRMPTATEFLDPVIPQYISDLISWVAIGARTIESQVHRELASGVSMPVGFKNNTDGNLQLAVNAMKTAQCEHSFLGINYAGLTSIVKTKGNKATHLILRGGTTGPNYDSNSVQVAQKILEGAGLFTSLIVDCSHGNSGKDPQKQGGVLRSVLEQRLKGNDGLVGVLIESHLKAGKQDISGKMEYGKSITDACIGWEETDALLGDLYRSL
jgi:3-deoxy-7-phosphoheptulonate synthase